MLFPQPGRSGLAIAICFFAFNCAAAPAVQNAAVEPNASPPGTRGLALAEYMQAVVEYNETVQARLLAFLAARSQRLAENGTFEPTWVNTGEYVDRSRPNTVELERSLRSGGFFKERNERYGSALEMQTPLGTRLRLGANAGQLINNIQRTTFVDLDAEYETQVGLVLEQPLLRGAGHNATLAALRIAARGSEMAYQEYRRQLMTVIADAELAYWQLYYAQQEVRLSAESVGLADTLVRDTRTTLEAGRGSQLDVLEAEAGLALRRSRQTLSQQRRVEALNRLVAFLGTGGTTTGVEAVDAPGLQPVTIAAEAGLQTALAMNPDLLRVHAQVGQEAIRAGYAKNQRLPQLDFKTSWGANGLGFDWTSAWRDVQKRNFPAWTVGLELRLPIFGNVRGRNEHRAAQLRLRQAQRMESEVTTQLRAGIDSAAKRVDAAFTAARSYEAVVAFRTNLLNTRLQSRDVGRLDSRSVLEAEQELFAARLDQLQSSIEYQRALLDLQVVSGTLLQTRGVEISFADLEQRTNQWMKSPSSSLPTLRYQPATFSQWPAAPAEPFVGEPDPMHPWRLRLTQPLPWRLN